MLNILLPLFDMSARYAHDINGDTPLHIAANAGNADVCNLLLDTPDNNKVLPPCSYLNMTNSRGQTCLHLAVVFFEELYLHLKSRGAEEIRDCVRVVMSSVIY